MNKRQIQTIKEVRENLLKTLLNEIKFCQNNNVDQSQDFKEGFIEGLRQAHDITILTIKTMLNEIDKEKDCVVDFSLDTEDEQC